MISTGGLPLTNSLLVVPDDEMPYEEEKTKLVRDVQGPKFSWISFSSVSWCTWNIFGLDISVP